MNLDDGRLDDIFRGATPMRTAKDATLSASDIALRESIIRGPSAKREHVSSRRRALTWGGLSGAVAATAVGVFLAVGVLSPPQSASALTPPPLVYENRISLDEAESVATGLLESTVGPVQTSQVHSVVWGWSAEMEEQRVEVVPQDITFDWSLETGSVTKIVASTSFWDDANRPTGVTESPYQPGEVIDEVVTSAEDFTAPAAIVGLSSADDAELKSALAEFGYVPGSSSGDLLVAIDGLMQYWTLSNAQHSALIGMLVDAGGATVLGETADRLGRRVLGIQVHEVQPGTRDTIFVSLETGRLSGTEHELLKPVDSLPAGVISYTMWDAGL